MTYKIEKGVNPKPVQVPDDTLLAIGAKRGDLGAFETLVRLYEKPLFNYIGKMTGRRDAEDLTQEVFLRVYRSMARFREGAPFRPWLFTIATNLCTDHLRSAGRRPTVPIDDDVARTGDGKKSLADTLSSATPNPAAVARAHELAERLQQALEKLPEKHRSVFVMARYMEMPYEEIAQALAVPVGTVKSRMNKAVNFLLEEMREVME